MSFHPQTPQSPSQLSPGTSDPLSSMNSSITSITTALPTPAHSVNGSTSQPFDMPHDIAMGEDSPHKRKRPLEDLGDREQKKVHIEDSKFGIEDLHLDVGVKYLICQTPHIQTLPRPTEDLFEMFNLTGIAAEVAREKPNGEKNALRKTYKGHIKKLGVLGHFDSVKKEWKAEEMGFKVLLDVPEEAFHFTDHGKNVADGFSNEVKASLSRAMTMFKGPIPTKTWDASVLGDLAPMSGDASKLLPSAKATAPSTPAATTPSAMARVKQLAGQAQPPARPQRTTKKRGYGENSFEGYGEGFPDDGYSTGDGDERGGQKRRKKAGYGCSPSPNFSNPSQSTGGSTPSFPNAMRQQGYGSGMVGA